MEEISNLQHGNIFKWGYAFVLNFPMIMIFILNVNNSSQGNYGIVWTTYQGWFSNQAARWDCTSSSNEYLQRSSPILAWSSPCSD